MATMHLIDAKTARKLVQIWGSPPPSTGSSALPAFRTHLILLFINIGTRELRPFLAMKYVPPSSPRWLEANALLYRVLRDERYREMGGGVRVCKMGGLVLPSPSAAHSHCAGLLFVCRSVTVI